MTGARKKVLLLIALTLMGLLWWYSADALTFEQIKAQRAELQRYYKHYPVWACVAFFALYVVVTAASLPLASLLGLAAGMVFGLFIGSLLVSFASTIGATLAFLVSRYLLRDVVRQKFEKAYSKINAAVERDGDYYLFALRLAPTFPFFVINLVMGLTTMSTVRYYVISQIGMLPGTLVYLNAGTQLGELETMEGLFSPTLLFSFLLLGILPLIGRLLSRRLLGSA